MRHPRRREPAYTRARLLALPFTAAAMKRPRSFSHCFVMRSRSSAHHALGAKLVPPHPESTTHAPATYLSTLSLKFLTFSGLEIVLHILFFYGEKFSRDIWYANTELVEKFVNCAL